jgi:hypothetical protein
MPTENSGKIRHFAVVFRAIGICQAANANGMRGQE